MKKTLLNTAVASVLSSALIGPAQADIVPFSFDALFTMVSVSDFGVATVPVQNTSYPYYGDPTWGYGKRTPLTGTMYLDTATGAGTGTIAPFEFFASGPVVAHDITLQAVGDGNGGPGAFVIGNMLFDWNDTTNISVQIVLDAAGLFGCMGGGMTVGDTCTGSYPDPLGATDGIKGNLPMGPVPVATSTLDTDGVSITGDDGIGGSPMDNGPFEGFSVNLDMTSVTMTSIHNFPQPVPIPAAVWLFGSGLICLVGFARRKKD